MCKNEINCLECGNHRELIFSNIIIKSLDDIVLVKNFPVFICKSCNSIKQSDMALKFLCKGLEDENIEILSNEKQHDIKKEMDFSKITNLLLNTQMFPSSSVDFLYDKMEYFFTPGLQRPEPEAFLTPVYFKIEVLLKYMHHPDYGIDIGSDTYGIFYKNNEFIIPFGINNHNRVILWLGDIVSLDKEEQYYLRSENVSSDHSLGSEFYDSQINIQWAKQSKVNVLLKNRFELFKAIREKYDVSMTHLELETITAAKKIRKMIIDTEDAFRDLILPLNEILIESIDVKSIKNNLKIVYPSEIKKFMEYKGIKILQYWLNKNTNNIDVNVEIAPLFVLYDLRIIMAHLESAENKKRIWESCCERLNLASDSKYLVVAERLIIRLSEMYSIFHKFLK